MRWAVSARALREFAAHFYIEYVDRRNWYNVFDIIAPFNAIIEAFNEIAFNNKKSIKIKAKHPQYNNRPENESEKSASEEQHERRTNGDMVDIYSPTTFNRNAIDIFGSVFTWHSYIPESRDCENFICNVHRSERSGRITCGGKKGEKSEKKHTHTHKQTFMRLGWKKGTGYVI